MHRGNRHQHDVILVVSEQIRSFRFQQAYDLERDAFYAHCSAYRIGGRKQILGDGLPDYANLGRRVKVALGEGAAPGKLPIPHSQI